MFIVHNRFTDTNIWVMSPYSPLVTVISFYKIQATVCRYAFVDLLHHGDFHTKYRIMHIISINLTTSSNEIIYTNFTHPFFSHSVFVYHYVYFAISGRVHVFMHNMVLSIVCVREIVCGFCLARFLASIVHQFI